MCTNKLNNLDGIGKFLERDKLSKLTKKEIENLNRPIRSKEIKSVTGKLSTRIVHDQMVSPTNSTKYLKNN